MTDAAAPPPPPPASPPPAAPPPPPPAAPPPAAGGSSNRTLMLVLSYLGILSLIPLLVEKDDEEVKWHAKHGLVLFLTWFVLYLGITIFDSMVTGGCLSCIVLSILGLVILGLHVFLIMKALEGKRVRLPIVTDLAEKF